MDSHSIGFVFALVILLLCSAYFSATETAFSALNRIRIKNLASEGNRKAKKVLSLLDQYDELLSAILVGNNIVNIASTSIATVLFIGLLGNYGAMASTIIMTVLVLIFGEITPKSLAKEQPEDFAMFSAPLIGVLMVVLKPLTFVFGAMKKGIMRVFKPKEKRSLTDGELLTLLEEAEEDGGIDSNEGELLRNVIEFDDIAAEEILTPRVDMVAVKKDESKETIARLFRETGYSRLPVYENSIDYIVGIIHEKNFYSYVWGTDEGIDTIIRPVMFIPPTTKLSSLLKQLQRDQIHMAVVVDEFGGTAGIVTLEDIIEEIVGDIWDEHDAVAQKSFVKQKNGMYLVYCSTDLDDLFDFFNLRCETEALSISGWVMEHFDEIPGEQDEFEERGLRFVVKRVENNRILEIWVQGAPIPDSFYEETQG